MTQKNHFVVLLAVLFQSLVLFSSVVVRAQECDIWVVAGTPGTDVNINLVLKELYAKGISPVRVNNLTELKQNVLDEMYNSSCCLRNLYIVGHGAPGKLSLYGNSVAPGEHIDGNSAEWKNILSEIAVTEGCIGDRNIYLFGCNVGARCEGSDKLFTMAKQLGANITVKAPIDRVVEADFYSNKLSDYLASGRWQEARNSMTSAPLCIDSLNENQLRERKEIIEQTWSCPCTGMFYSSKQACEAGCPSGLGCFTMRCVTAYNNNSWEKYNWEPVFWGVLRKSRSSSHNYDIQKRAQRIGRTSVGMPLRKPQASWDLVGVSQPCVTKETDGYRMWYMGWDATDTSRIGYATSYYGFDWTDHPNNPVLREGPPGSWDDGEVYNPSVLKDGSTYKMWYTGWSPTAKLARIGYATSPDGITWAKHTGSVLDVGASGTWDSFGVGAPSVTEDGGQYEMWYEGEDANGWWRIGYATSPDGINWTKHSDNPVLSEGAAGSWEEWGLGAPTVVKDGTTYEMWYHGMDSQDGLRIGHAVSQNGYHWTKSDKNPVLDQGYGDSWDNQGAGHPSVLKNYNENIFEIWYRGVNADEEWGIGYATSSAASSSLGIEDPLPSKSTPESCVLFQNYPNPFNPSTTIHYGLPHKSAVQLTVFNTLGQQVAVLQNGEMEAGYHEVKFDGSGLSSGVYFYRMQVRPLDSAIGRDSKSGAGSFVQTRKLVLLR